MKIIEVTSYMSLPGLKPGVKFKGDKDPNNIINIVCESLYVPVEKAKSIHRKREWVVARQLSMFLIRKHTDLSFKATAELFGGRDHTTAIHSIQTVNNLCDSDPDFKKLVLFIENKILS
jgi:chromosomal replication initiator protein